MSRKNDKRERLIEAADELVHQQTFNATTLADIATRADVPLGNVYYYFKTKDEILKAVVQKRMITIQTQFADWNQQDVAPKALLKHFIAHYLNAAEKTARFGSELGSLCQELGKFNNDLAVLGAELMQKTLNWIETQFAGLSKSAQAPVLAKHFLATLQGISLLTLTFKDPNFLAQQVKILDQWLETI
jgi:TetR/AcrR family transcriptional repressor of nem operon